MHYYHDAAAANAPEYTVLVVEIAAYLCASIDFRSKTLFNEMDLSKLPSVTFNDVLNDTQFCYHLVYPKFFNLAKKQNRTQASGTANRPPGALKNEKKRRRRGRPRKDEVAATKRSEEARRAPIENTTPDDKSDANIQCKQDSMSNNARYLIFLAINRNNFN